jgi:hypothetical protein
VHGIGGSLIKTNMLRKQLRWLYRYVWLPFVSVVWFSFPIQLLILNVRKNHLLHILWLLLIGITTDYVGSMIGLSYLFLEPEYINRVNIWSLFILGITLGGFTMSYHITCYILDSHRFGFLGHLRYPFFKYCINNSFFPLTFLIIYLWEFVVFGRESAMATENEIWWNVFGFLGGFFLMCGFFFFYFFLTNKDIFKILKKASEGLNVSLRKTKIAKINIKERYDVARKEKIRVDYYFASPIHYKRVTEVIGIDKAALMKVFNQNHFNAVIIQSTIFIVVMTLGYFEENPYFQIPAGASLVLLLTLVVMFVGAFTFWLKNWVITALIVFLLGFNYITKLDWFNQAYEVYGIDYETDEKPEYSTKTVRENVNDENFKNDYQETLIILNNWRAKFPKKEPPKIVFICASGGGQRASVWTMRTLQHVDSTLGGQLMNHTILMTGASGGIVGAAYFRELYLRQQQGEKIDIYANEYFENIARDNLNAIAFSWVVNDIFFRFQKFNYKGRTYFKDRGYAFEQQLNENTAGVLDKALCEYKEPEMLAQIPMMILSPTIVNDGRKLYISPQKMSYMCTPSLFQTRFLNQKTKGIEFLRFFKNQDSQNLRFLSALRMSATFPYVAPNVKLPSQPEMQIMDAGISDNFGVEAAARFIFVFKDWIQKNTSGVIIVSIRDTQKNKPIEKRIQPSLFQRLFTPLEGIYMNQEYMQDINNDNLIEYVQGCLGKTKIHRVEFEYVPISKNLDEIHQKLENPDKIDPNQKIIIERAVLSWHLTKKEKQSIHRTIFELRNHSSLRYLASLLNIPIS